MALSVGSFFKNAVKGAAQQYNQNVGYKREVEAKEEAAISASKRSITGDKELVKERAKWEAHYRAKIPAKKDEVKYAYAVPVLNASYNTQLFRNTIDKTPFGKYFQNGKIVIPRGANAESGNDQAKREDTFTQMSSIMTPEFFPFWERDKALTNTMITNLADAWQNNLVVEEDKTAKGKIVYTFKRTQWDYINSIPALATAVAQRIGLTVKELDKHMKETGDYSSGTGKVYEFDDDKLAISVDDFFKNNENGKGIFNNKQIDILKRIAPRTVGVDLDKPIKISTVANSMIDFAKSQDVVDPKTGKVVQSISAGEIVDAIAVAVPLLQNVTNPNSINTVALTDSVKDKLQKMGVNQSIYNDPQVLLRVLANALPAQFRYQSNLQFGLTGEIDLKNQGLLKRLVGGTEPRASMDIKKRSAQNLQQDAAQVKFLLDGGAESGASASIPRTITAFGMVVTSLTKSATRAFGGDGSLISKFTELFQNDQQVYNDAVNSGDEARIKNALLKFYATKMTFRLAADIQNTGGTQAGPRISDDDVARIQEGLQLLFLNDDVALRQIADAIHADAERKKVIYQAYMSADIKEVASAQLMQNMAGGDIVTTVFNISRNSKSLKGSKYGNEKGLYLQGFGSITEKIDLKLPGGGDGKGGISKDNSKEKKPIPRL